MNYFLKYRFAIWTVIILSVIILSSIGTLLFLKLSHNNDRAKDPEARRHTQIGQFFRNELKLTPDQENSFKNYRKLFFQNTKTIFDSIEKKRVIMIQELSKAKPDSLVLFQLSDEIGVLHAQLKKESIKNLLRLRSICTPEQIKKLNTINNELIMPEVSSHRMSRRKGPSPNDKK